MCERTPQQLESVQFQRVERNMSKQFLSDMTSLLLADRLCTRKRKRKRKKKALKQCFRTSVNSSSCDGSSTSAVRSCQSLVSLLRRGPEDAKHMAPENSDFVHQFCRWTSHDVRR